MNLAEKSLHAHLSVEWGAGTSNVVDAETVSESYLSSIGEIFVESQRGLEVAREKGLREDAVIRTSSPSLCLGREGEVQNVLAEMSPDRIKEYAVAMSLAVADLGGGAGASDVLKPYLPSLVQRATTFGNRFLWKAAMLRDADFKEPRAVVELDLGKPALNGRFNPLWPTILQDNRELRVLRVSATPPAEPVSDVAFLDRLRLSPAARLFRAMTVLSAATQFFRGRTVLVFAENELLRETANSLAFRGFSVVRPAPPAAVPCPLSEAMSAALKMALSGSMHDLIDTWIPESGRSTLKALLFDFVSSELQLQIAAENGWLPFLAEQKRRSHRVVALGAYPKGLVGSGLVRACRQFGIPFVSFQHGVTREICASHYVSRAGYEAIAADLFVAFNSESVRATKSVPFPTGDVVAAGLPAELWRTGRFARRKKDKPPIVYVSTNVLAGNAQGPVDYASDARRESDEVNLVRNVLARIPHRLTYKTYPEPRYVDEVPSIAVVREAPNIDLFDAGTNLKYLLRDYRVVVTSRATSTASYCLASGLPLVFINDPIRSPLTPEAYEAFQAGLFLFDRSHAAFERELLEFLSLSIDEIERIWGTKRQPRESLIHRFFSPVRRGSGKIAARHILEFLDEAAGRDSGAWAPSA